MPTSLRVPFGHDPKAVSIMERGKVKTLAFYWPGSDQKRAEILAVKRGSPSTFEAIYQCRPGAREGSIFLEDDFTYYEPPEGLELGIIAPKVAEFLKRGEMVVQAWDTAAEETKGSAWSVCVTALLVPCKKYHRGEDPLVWGECDPHYDVFILEVWRGKKDIGDLIMQIRSQSVKWRPDHIVIENKSSGIAAIQALTKSGYPIVPVAADIGKRARAIQGIGAGSAQGWFRRHRVGFPTNALWLPIYTTELKDFSGADDAVSDQADATVHLLRFAIMRGTQTAMVPTEWSPERGTPLESALYAADASSPLNSDPRTMFLTTLGVLPNMTIDPFDGLCGRCNNFQDGKFCSLLKVNKAAVDSCMAFEALEHGGLYVGN